MEAVQPNAIQSSSSQVEYMLNKVREEFDGVITCVADWGIYVQDQESMSEGMVRLATIKSDFFEHEAKKYRIKGQRHGKV